VGARRARAFADGFTARSSGGLPTLAAMQELADRPAELVAYRESTLACTRCRLAETRTQVVFGSGSPSAELIFVGEAPGFHEDQQGLPFVGAAGKLLERLLGDIGLTRGDVYIANVLKCRPPGNRDPMPDEIDACREHLFRQIELIRPRVVATLGNFATKLLSGSQVGITRVHGQEQRVTLGTREVLLYPLYHPAAALYTGSMLGVLEEDFRRLPELLARPASDGPAPVAVTAPAPAEELVADEDPEAPQLGLF
jgi:uracil-DNA glycosylase family 4